MTTLPYNFGSDGRLAGAAQSDKLLARLKELHPLSIDLSLGRIERLLGELGNPQDKLPPVVHVAGTNGKGSTIAFLHAIAEAMGQGVHIYISPHLVHFHERILLAGPNGAAPVSEDVLVDCLARAEEANGGELITLFEITTAAAFLAFAEAPADLLLLETGLGGRLDATNTVAKPLLTIITPVSIDHVSFLGESLPEIAGEKAGIIKPGVPCVVARQEKAALDVIEARANAISAPLHVAGRDFDMYEQQGRLVFQTASHLLDLPLPRLAGRHQLENAGTAIAAASIAFGDGLSPTALEEGVTQARWPARLERLPVGGLHAYVVEGTDIWLDGGHNEAGGRAVADALAELDDKVPRPVHVVWGMMENKNARRFISQFKGLAERVYTVPIPGEPNTFNAGSLAELAREEGFEAMPVSTVQEALLRSASCGDPARVLICGSLYLAGHVLKLHALETN